MKGIDNRELPIAIGGFVLAYVTANIRAATYLHADPTVS
jgi:hypothetical protein